MSKYTVYLYNKCSTCRDAQKFLEDNKIAFTRKEIVDTPPTLEELKRMLKHMGDIKKLFNTSGMQYRELGLSEKLKTMSVEDTLNLLNQNGMLVKRPFLIAEDRGLLGFKKEQWLAAIQEH